MKFAKAFGTIGLALSTTCNASVADFTDNFRFCHPVALMLSGLKALIATKSTSLPDPSQLARTIDELDERWKEVEWSLVQSPPRGALHRLKTVVQLQKKRRLSVDDLRDPTTLAPFVIRIKSEQSPSVPWARSALSQWRSEMLKRDGLLMDTVSMADPLSPGAALLVLIIEDYREMLGALKSVLRVCGGNSIDSKYLRYYTVLLLNRQSKILGMFESQLLPIGSVPPLVPSDTPVASLQDGDLATVVRLIRDDSELWG